MVYDALVRQAEALSLRSMARVPSAAAWTAALDERRRQWLDMLGLDPLPERTDLRVVVTGRLERDRHVVEKLHFQPIPGCRIAANLYRPRCIERPLPAIVYVCGHAKRSKCHYQAHPRWFARHGYVCLILDAIQIGENGGFHHGTYSRDWWHWTSLGYTPAAIEVWAAMRAADYLQGRPDVDPDKLGITGNSGGGTVSWFTGAADPRFRVVVPSCQTGTMFQHVRDRTVDGHCDCTFWVNTRGWDFTDVAALIAPRPLLVAAATEDTLFRPYAFRDLVQRVRRLYTRLGVPERIGLVEGDTPHGYSPATRLGIFSWFARHLQDATAPVTEDIDTQDEADADLLVHPGGKPPADDRLGEVDRFFIRLPSRPSPPASAAACAAGREQTVAALRQRPFARFPETIPVPQVVVRRQGASDGWEYTSLEFPAPDGVPLAVHLARPTSGPEPCPVLLGCLQPDARTPFCAHGSGIANVDPAQSGHGCVSVRGTGRTAIGPGIEWTLRRSYPIVGQSLYERQTLDLLTAVAAVRSLPGVGPVSLFGMGAGAAMAVYAALLDAAVAAVVLRDPVTTHWDGGPEFPGILRVGDLAANAAWLAPRPLHFLGRVPEAFAAIAPWWSAAGHAAGFGVLPSLADWRPPTGS